MSRSISDEDIDAIAKRLITLVAEKLLSPDVPFATPPQRIPEKPAPVVTKQRLAYTMKQLCEELSLSPVTIYRLEQRGLIKSLPAVRRKIYSHAEVQRLLNTSRTDWKLK